MTAGEGLALTYVIGTYPLLTTTFIDREIEGLRRRGVDVTVISLRRPHGPLSDDQTTAGVVYMRPVSPAALIRSHLHFLRTEPGAYWATLRHVVTAPHPSFFRRLKTLGHFGLAVLVAHRVDRAERVDHIHAHFVDRAALVALVTSRLTGIPYSATGHAVDIYVGPVLLPEKMAAAKFVATCTRANAEHLEATVSGSDRVRLLYHGLDVDSYEVAERHGRELPTLLAVGQLKEKKGFRYLIEACRILKESGRPFRCVIVGEGPLRRQLEAAVLAAGVEDVLELKGALSHEGVRAAYDEADLFVLPCVLGADGDRDGIPNVILEAMAAGLPVVSTRHSGIPEAVEDGVSGLLVPAGDAPALADALARLIDDPDLRGELGQMGRKQVAEAFDLDANIGRFLAEVTA